MLADYRSAPIGDKLKAMLAYLEKVTLSPEQIEPGDLAPLRAAGVSDQAIVDAVHICAAFQIYDRLADALGWDIPVSPSFWANQARHLYRRGYQGGRKPRSSPAAEPAPATQRRSRRR